MQSLQVSRFVFCPQPQPTLNLDKLIVSTLNLEWILITLGFFLTLFSFEGFLKLDFLELSILEVA